MLTFRPDVQGLRATAVLIVVIYHAFPTRLTGGYVGVDIFFVISGFLISKQIADAVDARTFSPARFFSRRAKRLLPAALLVIIVTVAWCLFAAPRVALDGIAADAIAAALYVPNIWFAWSGSDYLADPALSPFLHYWSLGLEEQFYLFWPVLLVLAGTVAARRRALIAAVVLLSFAAGVIVMQISNPVAFYLLPTRAWEFGAGALVALSPAWVARLHWRPLIGWLGVLGIVLCAVLYTDDTPFPGWAAAVPVLCTVAALVAGTARGGPIALLGTRPFNFVGDVSYSFYLWHWPALLVPSIALGFELPGWSKAALVAAAFAAAVVTYRFVEQPMRRAAPSPARVLTVSSAATGAVLAICILIITLPLPASPASAAEQGEHALTPSLEEAADDLPLVYRDGCHVDVLEVVSDTCLYGQSGAKPRIAVFGDSHAAQWFPALEAGVEERGGQLLMLTKSACPSVDIALSDERAGGDYSECYSWRTSAIERLRDFDPDLVILSNRGEGYAPAVSGDIYQLWEEGLTSTLENLRGLPVVILGDTPSWPETVPLCLSRAQGDESACTSPVGDLVDEEISRIESGAGVPYIDAIPLMCSAVCRPTEGDILVYRDDNHITATFSRSLADELWDLLPLD